MLISSELLRLFASGDRIVGFRPIGQDIKSSVMASFSEIEWLNSYFDSSSHRINEKSAQSVLYFALIWNLFESRACNKNANTKSIADKVNEVYSKGLLQLSDFSPFLAYYQDRYLSKGQINDTFCKLNFRHNDKKELIEAVLKCELDDINNIVLALLLIILRLRNNLFHGEKNIYTLSCQIDNFKVANQVLSKFLDMLKHY